MLTVFEYIKDQFLWLFVMGWHLVRYMGVGGRWMIMALRLIVYGILVTPSFAPHILWYMGSSTVIRRVRYRSSRKVKLEIVKALLHWRAAAGNQNGDVLDDYYDDKRAKDISPRAADHKNVSDWIEQSIAKKESAPTPTTTPPAVKQFAEAVKGASARDERKSAMIELLSDKHNKAQSGSNLQPDASLVKSHKSEIEKSNAAFLLRSIRTKLSFTDAILTQQEVEDGLEAPELQESSVEKITSVVVPIQNPKDTITSSTTRVQKQTQNGGKAKHGSTSSPLNMFPKLGESRISRVFGDDDEDELGIGQQPQLLASVNLLQQRAATIGAQHQQQIKAVPTPRNVAQNKESSGAKTFGKQKVASAAIEPQQLVMDDSDQDTLLFNYFQIFCDAYYKKKEDIRKKNKSGAKSTTLLPTTTPSVSPSPSKKQTTETFTSVMDPDILGLAKESLSIRDQLSQTLNPVELGISSGSTKSASKPPTVEEPNDDNQLTTKEAASFGTNPSQSFANPVSPALKNMKVATDNSSFYSGSNEEEGRAANINDVEGGEVSAATTPTKPIKPTIDVPPIPSPTDTEADFESESQVLDAFLEWVEEQCDSEDVRVHNRATLDVFVPIPLHDLLALRSSKQKQSQSPATLARAVADTPQDLSDDNGKCDMKAPKPASPPPTTKAPAQLKALMKGEAKPFKVCIMVSGGAWIIGCYLWSAILARFFAAAGYVVFVPDYRNFPQAAISGMVEDVTDAIVWVLKNAEIYNGDLSNVTLIGHSAGAHLSLLTILEQCRACQVQEELQRQNLQAEADHIASVSPSTNAGIQSEKNQLPAVVSSGKLSSDAFGETTVSEPGSGYGQIPTPVASAPEGNGTWSPSFESPQITPTTFSNLTTSFGNRSMLAVFKDLKHERTILKKTTNTPGSALGAASNKNTFSPSVTPGVSPRNLSSARQETRSPSREGAKPCSPPTVALDLPANYHPPLPTSFHNNTKPRFNPNTAITQWIGVSGIYDLPSLEGHFNKRGLYSKVLYALAGYWGDPSDGANRDTAIKDGAEVQRIKNKQQQEQDKAKLKAVADGTVDPTMLMKKSVKQSPLSQTVSGVFPPSASSNELDENILQGQGTTTTPGGQRRSAEGFETPLKALRRVSPWWMFVKEVPIKSPRPPRHHKLGDFPRKIINESLAKISTYALFTPSSPLSDWSIDSSSPAGAATTLVPDSTLVPYLPLNLKFLHGTEDDSAPLEESAAMVKVISEAIIDYVSSPPIDQQKKDGNQTVSKNNSSRRSPAPAIQNVVFLRASHTDPILEEILCGKCTVLEIAERRHHIGSSCPPRRREEQQMDERAESENKLSNYFFKFSSSLFTMLLAALMLPYVWGVRVFSFVFGNPDKQTNKQADKNHKSPGNKLKEDKKSAFKQPSPEHHSPANSSTSSLPLAHTSPGVPSYYETSLAVDKANMPRLVRWARKICPF